jgi:hypothetical protein
MLPLDSYACEIVVGNIPFGLSVVENAVGNTPFGSTVVEFVDYG